MVEAMIILTLAWTIGGITKEEYLNTGGFVAHQLSSNNIPIWIFPWNLVRGVCVIFFTMKSKVE